jgi:uncharacterized protein (UPF0276 family)
MTPKQAWPKLGCGLGLRPKHYPVITETWPKIDWFEAISENYMDSGGRPLVILEQIRAHYPIGLHGVALSIGSTDPLNEKYLQRLKALIERIQPALISDHLCWSGAGGMQLHDLLPLPFTEESLEHVVRRVEKVQDYLKRPILLENVSTYVTFKHSAMPEWEFLSQVAERSGCGILLDLNNIYVNSKNHGFDPYDYLSGISGDKIGQFHLAGHTDMGTYLFDTHSKPVIPEVWDLYREALRRWGHIATLIEWDEDIPEFPELMEEFGRAKEIYDASSSNPRKIACGEPVSYHSRPDQGRPLKEVQEWMKTWVAPAADRRMADFVTGGERLIAYSGGYVARIYEALKEAYEAVRRLLGEKEFVALAEPYAKRYPSQTYNLTLAGSRFAEFLHENPVKGMPYLEDLARLEWLMVESFHAFDEAPFDQKQLAKIPLEDWEQARLIFQSSVRLFAADWPVLELWTNRKVIEPGMVLKKEKQYLLIGRRGIQVRCEFLDEKQHRFLESLLCGRTLGEACEDLAAASGEEDIPVAEWFARWVQDGLIARCEIAGKNLTA